MIGLGHIFYFLGSPEKNHLLPLLLITLQHEQDDYYIYDVDKYENFEKYEKYEKYEKHEKYEKFEKFEKFEKYKINEIYEKFEKYKKFEKYTIYEKYGGGKRSPHAQSKGGGALQVGLSR